jgi:hypothetical protein
VVVRWRTGGICLWSWAGCGRCCKTARGECGLAAAAVPTCCGDCTLVWLLGWVGVLGCPGRLFLGGGIYPAEGFSLAPDLPFGHERAFRAWSRLRGTCR